VAREKPTIDPAAYRIKSQAVTDGIDPFAHQTELVHRFKDLSRWRSQLRRQGQRTFGRAKHVGQQFAPAGKRKIHKRLAISV
jgi:hypothetical protein